METIVLASTDPMYLAQQFIRSEFTTGTNVPGLLFFRGVFWEYNGGEWVVRDPKLIADQLRWWLPNIEVPTDDGEAKTIRTTKGNVEDILACVETVVRLNRDVEFPLWLGEESEAPVNPHCILTFQDGMYDPVSGDFRPREPYWLEPLTIPCKWEAAKDAKCPVWEKCLGEWSKGDKEWEELLERWMGYCLMPHFTYKKWMLMYGKFNGGKGVIAKVLQALLGRSLMKNRTLVQLSQQFGLDGLQNCRVINVTEAGELDRAVSDHTSQELKRIVGRDGTAVGRKYKGFLEDIVIPAKIMMQGNQIPNLGNMGRGLSSKMLLLPFTVSFGEDKPMDPRLDEKLMAELPGIARRVAEAAGRLEKAEMDKKWPTAGGAGEVMKAFHLRNNPADAFLEAWFVKNPTGQVETQFLADLWEKWNDAMRLRPEVGMYRLASWLVEKSSWDLSKGRTTAGRSCVRGLSLKKGHEEKGWDS